MKKRNLGYLGLLGTLGIFGSFFDMPALYGLYGFFAFYGFFGTKANDGAETWNHFRKSRDHSTPLRRKRENR